MNLKKKIGNSVFDYKIYKNVLNKEIYDKIIKNYKKNDFFPIHRK